MRILQVINALTWGGAQVLVLDLCRFLARSGHNVAVAAFRDGPVGNLLRDEGIRVEILSEHLFDLIAFFRLQALIKEFSPHILHTHLFRATFWGRLAAPAQHSLKIVTSVHGIESAGYQRLEGKMSRLSDRLIFPSQYLQAWYSRSIGHYPEHRVQVLYPGARVLASPLANGLPLQTTFGEGNTSHPPRIGALSRLHPLKGLDTFIEACAQLRDRHIPFEAIIGGEGRDIGRLTELTRSFGLGKQVRFVGSIFSTPEFFQDLDLFVSASREEAFGITICEAMERGLPVIASRVGGIPEVVEDEQCGLLFQAGDATGMAEKMGRLLADPATRQLLGTNGRQRVLRHFDRKQWLDHHLKLYEDLAPTQKKSLLVVISSRELGGGERMALALAEKLKARGWNISALCTGNPLAGWFEKRGIPATKASMRFGGLFLAARLGAILHRSRPSVLHAHLNKAALFAGFLGPLWHVPVIAHVHGLNRASYYKRCDLLVAVSQAVGRHLSNQGVLPGQLVVSPNCIDKELMFVQRNPGPPWVIAIPAKLHRNKGHRWALTALETACSRLPDFQIWVFGDGPEKSTLQTRFSSGPLSKRLHFHGFKSNLDHFYPDVHVVMLPSLGEGIPLSLLEAMRWRIPVLATRVGGIPEIVVDGENGLLVPPEDGEALIQSLARLLNPEIWKVFSEKSAQLFQEKNDFNHLMDKLEQNLQAIQR